MSALRHGCEAAIRALADDDALVPDMSPDRATDLFWMMLQVPNWEHLTKTCGWSQAEYIAQMQGAAVRMFVQK